jgi:hypothetical protein
MKIRVMIDKSHDAFQQIWDLQDGFAGLPISEYDWSGIRDSSTLAVLAMLDVARDVVGRRTGRGSGGPGSRRPPRPRGRTGGMSDEARDLDTLAALVDQTRKREVDLLLTENTELKRLLREDVNWYGGIHTPAARRTTPASASWWSGSLTCSAAARDRRWSPVVVLEHGICTSNSLEPRERRAKGAAHGT